MRRREISHALILKTVGSFELLEEDRDFVAIGCASGVEKERCFTGLHGLIGFVIDEGGSGWT